MSDSNASDPAYPCESFPDRDGDITRYHGLSKRELFAAMAMQGFCSCPNIVYAHASGAGGTAANTRTVFAKAAVDMADKLISALDGAQ